MRIFGAGLAGLLAAHMLRRYEPVVHEWQPSLPNNHDALLRFRSDAVARATGIPFKKVTVRKLVFIRGAFSKEAFLPMQNMYAQKVIGKVIPRSVITTEPVERYIAPPDFIAHMAKTVTIEYNSPLTTDIVETPETPIISTIPMPALMDLVKWEDKPQFGRRGIVSITADILEPECDVYQTIYYPEPQLPWYRASITGNKFIVELVGDDVAEDEQIQKEMMYNILSHFGLSNILLDNVQLHKQYFGKIDPLPEDQRKEFILAMTDLHNVYSVGRFATWRQILLDDVVHDVEVVERFIRERSSYQRKLYCTA